jgi:hypothetical protein
MREESFLRAVVEDAVDALRRMLLARLAKDLHEFNERHGIAPLRYGDDRAFSWAQFELIDRPIDEALAAAERATVGWRRSVQSARGDVGRGCLLSEARHDH